MRAHKGSAEIEGKKEIEANHRQAKQEVNMKDYRNSHGGYAEGVRRISK
jgi:hypothetical protein